MALVVRDESTGRVLVDRLECARSHWDRFRGLMLRRAMPHGSGLLIEPCRSIHMMFMRFPIDVVFVDAAGTVTRVSRGVRPWVGFAIGGRGSHAVYELPKDAAADVRPGHRLQVVEVEE